VATPLRRIVDRKREAAFGPPLFCYRYAASSPVLRDTRQTMPPSLVKPIAIITQVDASVRQCPGICR
jgi:hypothetical protein